MDEVATMPVVRTQKLSKYFGSTVAVDHLDWEVHPGSIYGLLGENGAGKTTLMKMLLGLTRATSGRALVWGLDVARDNEQVRSVIAYVLEDRMFYERFLVGEFVRFYRSFFPQWHDRFVTELLKRWEIPTYRRVHELSKGMRAKLLLTVSLGRQPRILLLDEPTIDLDPASVEEIFAVLAQWVTDHDRAIVLATHRMDEAERMCDQIGIMDRGQLLAEGNLDEMRGSWKTLRGKGTLDVGELRNLPGVVRASSREGVVTLVVREQADARRGDLELMGASNLQIQDMNLREIYLAVVNFERGRLDDLLESLD